MATQSKPKAIDTTLASATGANFNAKSAGLSSTPTLRPSLKRPLLYNPAEYDAVKKLADGGVITWIGFFNQAHLLQTKQTKDWKDLCKGWAKSAEGHPSQYFLENGKGEDNFKRAIDRYVGIIEELEKLNIRIVEHNSTQTMGSKFDSKFGTVRVDQTRLPKCRSDWSKIKQTPQLFQNMAKPHARGLALQTYRNMMLLDNPAHSNDLKYHWIRDELKKVNKSITETYFEDNIDRYKRLLEVELIPTSAETFKLPDQPNEEVLEEEDEPLPEVPGEDVALETGFAEGTGGPVIIPVHVGQILEEIGGEKGPLRDYLLGYQTKAEKSKTHKESKQKILKCFEKARNEMKVWGAEQGIDDEEIERITDASLELGTIRSVPFNDKDMPTDAAQNNHYRYQRMLSAQTMAKHGWPDSILQAFSPELPGITDSGDEMIPQIQTAMTELQNYLGGASGLWNQHLRGLTSSTKSTEVEESIQKFRKSNELISEALLFPFPRNDQIASWEKLLRLREEVQKRPGKEKQATALEKHTNKIKTKCTEAPWLIEAIIGDMEMAKATAVKENKEKSTKDVKATEVKENKKKSTKDLKAAAAAMRDLSPMSDTDPASKSHPPRHPSPSRSLGDVAPIASSETVPRRSTRKRHTPTDATAKRKHRAKKSAQRSLSDDEGDFMKTSSHSGYIGGLVDGIPVQKKVMKTRKIGRGDQLLLKFFRPGFDMPTYETIASSKARGARDSFLTKNADKPPEETIWHIEDSSLLKHQTWEAITIGGIVQNPGRQRTDTNTLPATIMYLSCNNPQRSFERKWFRKSDVVAYFGREMVTTDEILFAKLSGQKLATKWLDDEELRHVMRSAISRKKKASRSGKRGKRSRDYEDSDDDEDSSSEDEMPTPDDNNMIDDQDESETEADESYSEESPEEVEEKLRKDAKRAQAALEKFRKGGGKSRASSRSRTPSK